MAKVNKQKKQIPIVTSKSDDWFGYRHFYEKKTWLKKEILEVTVYREFETICFRYFTHDGWRITGKEGIVSDFRDAAVPFWVRKVLFSFYQSHTSNLFRQ